MDKEKLMPISIFFLGISIIIASYLISSAITQFKNNIHIDTVPISRSIKYMASEIHELNNDLSEERTEEKQQAMYMSDAAEYLGLSFDELNFLIEKEHIDIPYIKVNRMYVFYKNSIDNWLKDIEKQEYVMPN